MQRVVVVSGSLLGGIAVATGAFGAHALRTVLDASGQAGNWETATRYALVHALATVVAGIMACLLYTSPSPRDGLLSRMPSSA